MARMDKAWTRATMLGNNACAAGATARGQGGHLRWTRSSTDDGTQAAHESLAPPDRITGEDKTATRRPVLTKGGMRAEHAQGVGLWLGSCLRSKRE
jgi:hypothetical protein